MAVASALGSHNVFVYGSLLADEVVHVLLTRAPSSSPALLPNFQRVSIRGRVYPAILSAQNNTVTGKVLKGLTDAELEMLDKFEDKKYIRKSVEISLLDGSEKLLAEAYVWSTEDDPDLHGDWDFEEWKRLHIDNYLARTKAFMERIGGAGA
ncbi:AIG2-like (avirulence induced gene) family protein isoform X4 [Carex rostrata]